MKHRHLLARTALGIAIALGAVATIKSQESDDASRRDRARAEWYNEKSDAASEKRGKQGGPWSADYRRFMLDAAARERAKWGHLIPSNPDAAAAPDPGARGRRLGTGAGESLALPI